MSEREKARDEEGEEEYPTSISTNVVASRTFEPLLPLWGFTAFLSIPRHFPTLKSQTIIL